jgi:hypothetical protein
MIEIRTSVNERKTNNGKCRPYPYFLVANIDANLDLFSAHLDKTREVIAL